MYMPGRAKDYGQKDGILRLMAADFEWAIHQLEAEREKAELGYVEIPSSTPDRYEDITCNKYDRNPNTGEPFGTATKTISAVQTIHHSKQYPSHITLPVIPR